MKGYLGRITLLALSALLALVLLEIGFRIYYHWKGPRRYASLDEKLGWRNAENLALGFERKDAAGRTYRCSIRTDANGFREYGAPRLTNRSRILVLGDSFTAANEVSNEDTYYRLLKSALNVEMFAYGCGGFGTLQEYLVLDRFVDRIQPTVLVLQLCHNDFINNCYELELETPEHNNGLRRPYLQEDGTIVYALPKTDLPALRSFGNKHSRLLYFAFSKIDRTLAKRHVARRLTWPDPVTQWQTNAASRKSVVITDRLFRMIRERVSRDTVVYAFEVDQIPPYFEEFKRLANKNKFVFVGEVAEALRQAEQKGQTIRARDKWHLNPLGHQIVAQVLAERLSQVR